MENSMLLHYGIKGMKWGVRRYQNKDGTLTAAGRQRKSKEQKESEKQKRRDNRERGTLTDAELRQKINRLQLEQQLDKLTKEQVDQGREYVTGILKDIGKKVAVTAGAGAVLYGLKVAASGGTQGFSPAEFANAVFNGGAKKK